MSLVSGKALWASITTPQTRFPPPKYTITLIVDDETATQFEQDGFRIGVTDEGEKTLTMKRTVEWTDSEGKRTVEWTDSEGKTMVNDAPKLMDADKDPLDAIVGNGSDVVVQFRPYTNNYGKFMELQAVQVLNLIEYEGSGPADGEEF